MLFCLSAIAKLPYGMQLVLQFPEYLHSNRTFSFLPRKRFISSSNICTKNVIKFVKTLSLDMTTPHSLTHTPSGPSKRSKAEIKEICINKRFQFAMCYRIQSPWKWWWYLIELISLVSNTNLCKIRILLLDTPSAPPSLLLHPQTSDPTYNIVGLKMCANDVGSLPQCGTLTHFSPIHTSRRHQTRERQGGGMGRTSCRRSHGRGVKI